MQPIILRDPNNDIHERLDKFWTSFITWLKERPYMLSNDDLSQLYKSDFGKEIPLSLSFGRYIEWEELIEFIELFYKHLDSDVDRDDFSANVNQRLKQFSIDFEFKEGKFINSNNVALLPEVKELDHWLKNYPVSYCLYKSAMQKLENNQYNRNVLDDLRLSMEDLARNLTGSNKTLENLAKSDLGKALKNKDVPSQIREMLIAIVKQYAKYNDDNVKHHDDVNEDDIEIMVSLSCILMKYMIRRLG